MKLTAQQMQQLEKCSSAEEIITLAKKANINITMEQAQKAFDVLKSGDIPDEILQQMTGGGSTYDASDCYKFKECTNKKYI